MPHWTRSKIVFIALLAMTALAIAAYIPLRLLAIEDGKDVALIVLITLAAGILLASHRVYHADTRAVVRAEMAETLAQLERRAVRRHEQTLTTLHHAGLALADIRENTGDIRPMIVPPCRAEQAVSLNGYERGFADGLAARSDEPTAKLRLTRG